MRLGSINLESKSVSQLRISKSSTRIPLQPARAGNPFAPTRTDSKLVAVMSVVLVPFRALTHLIVWLINLCRSEPARLESRANKIGRCVEKAVDRASSRDELEKARLVLKKNIDLFIVAPGTRRMYMELCDKIDDRFIDASRHERGT